MRTPVGLDRVVAFLKRLEAERFYGKVTVSFQGGKATHVESNCRRSWETGKLPVDADIIGEREPTPSRRRP